MTASISAKPRRSGACSLETRKSSLAAGKFSRTTCTAGSVNKTSPMDLSRMSRMCWGVFMLTGQALFRRTSAQMPVGERGADAPAFPPARILAERGQRAQARGQRIEQKPQPQAHCQNQTRQRTMVFGEESVTRTPIFDSGFNGSLPGRLPPLVPDVDLWQMENALSAPARLQAEIRFLEKEEVAFVQPSEQVPNRLADQHERADDGFHFHRLAVLALLAGEFFGAKPPQQRFIQQLGRQRGKIGDGILA